MVLDLDPDLFQRESVLAGAALDLLCSWGTSQHEQLFAAWWPIISGLSPAEHETLMHWCEVFACERSRDED